MLCPIFVLICTKYLCRRRQTHLGYHLSHDTRLQIRIQIQNTKHQSTTTLRIYT